MMCQSQRKSRPAFQTTLVHCIVVFIIIIIITVINIVIVIIIKLCVQL